MDEYDDKLKASIQLYSLNKRLKTAVWLLVSFEMNFVYIFTRKVLISTKFI